MLHPLNQQWFNVPVDAEGLGLPDYHDLIAEPMDLGTIKSRLASFQYSDVSSFARDVRLVFENATAYNPPRNAVHAAAVAMSRDFDADLERALELRAPVPGDPRPRARCAGKQCVLCGDKCLTLEAPALICSGPCGQRVRRDQHYHVTRDGSRLWCHKCYLGLKSVIPPPADHGEPAAASGLWYKRDLIKRKFDEDVAEPWVQCDACWRWVHQTCALFNAKAEADRGCDGQRFVCPLCELQGAHLDPPEDDRRRKVPAAQLEAATKRRAGLREDPKKSARRTTTTTVPRPLKLAALTSNSLTLEADFDVPPGARAATARATPRVPGAGGPPDRAARGLVVVTLTPGDDESGASYELELADGRSWHGPVDDGAEDAAPARRSPGPTAGRRRKPRRGRFAAPDLSWWSAALPETAMTKALEAAVKARMVELGGESAAHAPSVAVRLVSCVPQSLRVQGMLRKHFVGPGGAELPEAIPFESRSVVLFQKNDGVDLCVFSMYVHEFGDACGPSAKRVYVAYLDSVEYFRPRTARTEVYHELLVAYLDWSRRRGFTAAHIWACPPQRGNNFIFWCHPTHQRTPSRERLTEWYRAMVRRAVETGAVSRVASPTTSTRAADTMRRRHKPGDRKRNPAWVDKLEKPPAKKDDEKKDEASCRDAPRPPDPNSPKAAPKSAPPLSESQSSEAPACPPLFDGDYWPEECCRLVSLIERRKGLFGSHSLRSQNDVSVYDHFVNLLKHVVQQPSSYPFMAPVDAEALGLADYHDVVKAPMDLGTVERRLGAGSYANPQKLVDDAATHLGCVFEKKLQNLLQRLKSAGQLDDAEVPPQFPLRQRRLTAAPPPPPPPSAPSLRARLLPELASSVHKMKDSQFVLYLQPDERPPTEPGAPARPRKPKGPSSIDDPDADTRVTNALVDSRHTFLEMCQFWHYQFDTLRRAKHSSIMLLYHLHNPHADSLAILCSNCSREVARPLALRDASINICRDCERQGRQVHHHSLTPFRITFARRRALPPPEAPAA
ncbi:histone acetyltransferase [Aureococcus anophagefferens]|nr:histone acetyltransferase [Aureococcus anophagefferens]